MLLRQLNKDFILVSILISYLVSRLLGLLYFAPHTDESVYTQVAMLMAEDWEKNKYFSLDGRMYDDYKEPLHFWITSFTVSWWKNPLIGMRIWSIILGFLGLFFTQLLVLRVCGRTAAIFTATLIVLSEYYLYFDSIGIQEVFLYGLGAVFLYFLYDFLEKTRWPSVFIATIALAAILTTKTSSQMWIVLSAVLPLLVLFPSHQPLEKMKTVLFSKIMNLYIRVIGVVVLAEIIHRLLIPSRFDEVKQRSLQITMVRNIDEILQFPFADWINNLKFYWNNVLLAR